VHGNHSKAQTQQNGSCLVAHHGVLREVDLGQHWRGTPQVRHGNGMHAENCQAGFGPGAPISKTYWLLLFCVLQLCW
jgi:hypothetical protein